MIIADTGYFVAVSSTGDHHHARAMELSRGLSARLVTTWPVMTETCHLLATRAGAHVERAFLRLAASGAFDIFDVERSHLRRVDELMAQYADLPMDLADASLVVLAEHLGRGDILSTDQRDFRTYRWKNRRPFKNLLLP